MLAGDFRHLCDRRNPQTNNDHVYYTSLFVINISPMDDPINSSILQHLGQGTINNSILQHLG